MSGKYYVYVHKKPDGEVFYVGKGCANRYLSNRHRSEYWRRIVAKYGFVAEIVHGGLTEDEAFSMEVLLIEHYGRDALCNLTDGGDGPSGYRHSEESRRAMSKSRTGKKHSQETIKKMSEWHKMNCNPPFRGKNLSEDHRRKISQSMTGCRNGRFNGDTHVFVHPEHGAVCATQNWMVKTFGLHHGAISGMVSGAVKSCKCWSIDRSKN